MSRSTFPPSPAVAHFREKKLTNVRNHGKDENVMLAPPRVLPIETAMEWIDADELVEVTPEAVRVRKQILRSTCGRDAVRPSRTRRASESVVPAGNDGVERP